MTSAFSRAARNPHIVVAVVGLTALVMFISPIGAYDLWWHLKAGEIIFQTGEVPREDPFSFTADGQPWTYHSWLSGVLLYLTHRLAGRGGLIVLRALLMAGSLLLMWVAARRRGVGTGLACILVLASCLQLQVRALTRPYLFSFLLFSVFYVILQRAFDKEAPRGPIRSFLWGRGGRLALLPPLTVAWANLHAGFVAGLLMLGAFGVGELVAVAGGRRNKSCLRTLCVEGEGTRFRALLVAGALCLAGGMITPYGPDTLTYPFRLLTQVKLARQVMEWQPMPLSASYAVFWAIVALTGVVLVRSACLQRSNLRTGLFWADVFLMAGFGLLAVRSQRNLAWTMLLVPPVVGCHILAARQAGPDRERTAGGDRRRDGLYAVASLALALALGLTHAARGRLAFGVARDRFPERACDYMAGASLKGDLYNEYAWGGYLIWRFWPERRVFIDGRCLVYGDKVIGEAISVSKGQQGWESILEKYDVEGILVPYRRRDSRHFFRRGKWHCVYWDDTALLAVRGPAQDGTEGFPLSNPVTFDERLDDTSPAAVLAEVDQVLAGNPDCWTAWTFRARCLLRMARGDEQKRAELLAGALDAARRAVRLTDGRHEACAVLDQCRKAIGAGAPF